MTLKRLRTTQGGFTLIELLVVIGILAILLAITLIALNPTQHFEGARNAQRSSDVAAILDGIYEYEAAHSGNLPASVSSVPVTPTEISNTSGDIDLCSDLVPTYLADLPSDPNQTTPRTPAGAVCTSATAYDTGYKIAKSTTGNRFTVSAPLAEGNPAPTISVTR